MAHALSPAEEALLRDFMARLRAAAPVGAIAAIRVFGSRARGDSNERSDLDVAVELAGEAVSALVGATSSIPQIREPIEGGAHADRSSSRSTDSAQQTAQTDRLWKTTTPEPQRRHVQASATAGEMVPPLIIVRRAE